MGKRGARQQRFLWKTRGGRREGAGRKAAPENVGLLPHVARPEFVARVPAHVTMRALRGVPKMRAEVIAAAIIEEIGRASSEGFRILHHSVQDDHLHLIAEGDDGAAFSRGMQRLASRVARTVNLLVGRRGRFWRERYHRRDLPTPRQFRNALVYVTNNFRKHAPQRERAERARTVDLLSSGIWFDGWSSATLVARLRELRVALGRPPPVARGTTWIANVGWKRLGLIDARESPKMPG